MLFFGEISACAERLPFMRELHHNAVSVDIDLAKRDRSRLNAIKPNTRIPLIKNDLPRLVDIARFYIVEVACFFIPQYPPFCHLALVAIHATWMIAIAPKSVFFRLMCAVCQTNLPYGIPDAGFLWG